MKWRYLNKKHLNLYTEKRFLFVIKTKKNEFNHITNNKVFFYKKVKKIKKDGKRFREIYMPEAPLKKLLKRINRQVLSLISFPPYVHCGPKDRSIVTAVYGHKGFKHHLALDIDSFFDSVSRIVMSNCLKDIGFNDIIVDLILNASVEDNRLPQGFPTSSRLSALVVSHALEGFGTLFPKVKLSVYADDILLSSNNKRTLKKAENYIKDCLGVVGLRLNLGKKEVGRKGSKFDWLGVHLHPWPAYPRLKLIEFQKDVYEYKKTGKIPDKYQEKFNKNETKKWRRSMKGRVQFAKMVSQNKLQNKIVSLLREPRRRV